MFTDPISFQEAEEALAARLDRPTALRHSEIAARWDAYLRARSFFSARVAEATVLSQLRDKVEAVLSGRMSASQARDLLTDYFVGEGADPLAAMGFAPPRDARGVSELASVPRLNLILETNVRMAQECGQYRQWADVKDYYGYGRWVCGFAEEHRPEHLRRDGRVYPFDHPIWTQSPPGGEFNCHCSRELLSAEDIEDEGLTPEPLDSDFQPSSLGFDPSRPLDYPPEFGRRVRPDFKEAAENRIRQEQKRLEAERKAREEQERLEAERKAREEQERLEAERKAREDAEHKAHRQEQWQRAYEKRRDTWKTQCEAAIPVSQNHPEYPEYKRVVDTVVAQYTPEAAKLGKPPRLDLYSGKDAWYRNDDNTLRLGGFQPRDEWFHCEGAIRHEWGHWAHNRYYDKYPGIASEIKAAGDADWDNVKRLFRGRMNTLQGVYETRDVFSRELFGTFYSDLSRSVSKRFVCSAFADCIGQMSKLRYGGGHDRDYYMRTFQTDRRVYNECIANVRSLLGFPLRPNVEKYFPNLLAIVERMNIL